MARPSNFNPHHSPRPHHPPHPHQPDLRNNRESITTIPDSTPKIRANGRQNTPRTAPQEENPPTLTRIFRTPLEKPDHMCYTYHMTNYTLSKHCQPQPNESPNWYNRFHTYLTLEPSHPRICSWLAGNQQEYPLRHRRQASRRMALERTRHRLRPDQPPRLIRSQGFPHCLSPPSAAASLAQATTTDFRLAGLGQ